MWGRPGIRQLDDQLQGNTPTHVGKTKKEAIAHLMKEKHPHACGEDPRYGVLCCPRQETPPRMWGRHHIANAARISRRNTPTHVGKTSAEQAKGRDDQKHPHACGEDFSRQAGGRGKSETPPRMWGRHQHIVFSGVLKRQIYNNCAPQGFRISINIHQTKEYVPISPPSICC